MKTKMVVLSMAAAIMVTLLFGNVAYALSTSQTIYLRVRVVGALSLNLEDKWLQQNLHKPEVEAFSELKEEGVSVDKLSGDNSTLWLFTKTE